MSNQKIRFSWIIAILAVVTGCPQCAPDQVGPGVARLTVRNVGAMVSLVNADTNCGFASPAVLAAGVVEGQVGSAGSITFTVNQCVIDVGEGRVGAPDCSRTSGTTRGKVTITATRRIEGTLTGLAQTPIIPANADAVTINVSNATFENFEARSPFSGNTLTMISGSLSATVKPRLAVSSSSGACAIATPNVTFTDITYSDAQLHLTTPTNSFDVPVPTSNIDAQNGAGPSGDENALSGTITVFESPVTLSGDLDPEYDADRFTGNYACTPDLAQPISYACADIRPRLAEGAARLSAKMQGTITSMIDANTSCGFSAPAVLGAAQFNGVAPGDTGGSMTLTVTNCTLSFADTTPLTPGCDGSSTTVKGSITVSGTKTVVGRFTGNPLQPIVPVSSQPATISLVTTVNAGGFKLGSTADGNALEVLTGTLTGSTKPRLYIGATTGVCSVSSPNADFTADWSDADFLVSSSSGTLALNNVDTDLTATNGKTDDTRVNTISGTVTVDGTEFTIAPGPLSPVAYDQAAFDATWQCGATATALADPPSSACATAVVSTIGGGAAALTARTFGTVMSLIDANTSCGFSSAAVATAPALSGNVGVGNDDVTATFTLAGGGCTITLPADTVVSADCAGNTTTVGGSVTVTGTKAVTGFLTGSSNPAEAIVPTSFKPAEFNLSITFNEFVVKSQTSTAFMTVHDGTLAGKGQPRTALNPLTGACSLATPNVTFTDLTWTNGEVTVNSSGSNFNALLNTSNLDAQNGSDLTTTNSLSGSLTIDGIPLTGIAAPLDRAFNQTAFDASYVCAAKGNPVLVPDAACSFRQVLGGAAARLLAGSVAVATKTGDAICLQPNEAITGAIGGPGSSSATVTNCTVAPSSTVVSPDCSGGELNGSGSFVLSGTRTKNPALVIDGNSDGTADTAAPLSETATTFDDMSYDMTAWQFEKFFTHPTAGRTSAGRLTLTGNVGVETFMPVLAALDDNEDDVADPPGLFTKSTPIFQTTGLTLPSGAATLLLQGKTFRVTLTNVDLDVVAGAFNGLSNSISGTMTVDGEPVALAPAFDSAFSQSALDAQYSCDPKLILVPPN